MPIEWGYRHLSRYQQQLSGVECLITARAIVRAKLKNSRILLRHQKRRRVNFNRLYSLHSSQASKNSVRYAVTVCFNSQESDSLKYSIHPYSNSPREFTTIEDVALVKSTVRRSPASYNLQTFILGDCYTAYLGLFPGDGYALGFFYLSKPKPKYIYRVGYNTLIGNIKSCLVTSLESSQCR